MIESVYETFGFVGSLVVALSIFMFFIFWMAGVAGLCESRDKKRLQTLILFLAIIIPVYPVGWVIWEMITQNKKLNKL